MVSAGRCSSSSEAMTANTAFANLTDSEAKCFFYISSMVEISGEHLMWMLKHTAVTMETTCLMAVDRHSFCVP